MPNKRGGKKNKANANSPNIDTSLNSSGTPAHRGAYRGRGGANVGRRQYDPQMSDDLDILIRQLDSSATTSRGRALSTPGQRARGRGRGRGGRGRGLGAGRIQSDFSHEHGPKSMSQMHYSERPYLKPIIFVRSQFTATLFEDDPEELMQATENIIESADETRQIPTAKLIDHVTSGHFEPMTTMDGDDEIEEIDFTDLGRLAQISERPVDPTTYAETVFTGGDLGTHIRPANGLPNHSQTTKISVSPVSHISPTTRHSKDLVQDENVFGTSSDVIMSQNDEESLSFFVDTVPTQPTIELEAKTFDYAVGDPLPTDSDEDDIIVYDAPNPRVGQDHESRPTGAGPVEDLAPKFSSVSFSFDKPSPAALRAEKRKARRQQVKKSKRERKQKRTVASFSFFGLQTAEAQINEDEGRDEDRRYGSDIDWGSPDDDEVDDLGMDVDSEIDVDAMRSFVKSMEPRGQTFVTMEDLEDIGAHDNDSSEDGDQPLDTEDEIDELQSSSDDEDDFDLENLILGNSTANKGPGSSYISTGQGATSDFQNRLQYVRNQNSQAGSNAKRRLGSTSSTSEEEDELEDDEDAFMLQIRAMVEREQESRPSQSSYDSKVFDAVQNGDIDLFEEILPKKRKDRWRDYPEELQIQWKQDRDKKAERKRLRAQARLEAAADPFALHGSGKKSRKATRAAAKLDPTITVIPNRIFNMATLEVQLRAYLLDTTNIRPMTLPPMDKTERKRVHQLAEAFGLTSKSKGKGQDRYTTLTKSKQLRRTVNESKVRQLLKANTRSFGGIDSHSGKKTTTLVPRQKEGEEVGKTAPRIDASNVGFRMLSSMGWSQGASIGHPGSGLEVPLTAVIKNSKLGLGAAH